MRVHLVSFGPLKTIFPEGGLWRELRVGESVAGLLALLRHEGVVADDMLRSAAVAVNHEYAGLDQGLCDGDEVALLPPVSGGSEVLVQLVREPIDAVTMERESNNTRGRQTLHLDYEAYEEMALRQMHELRVQAIAKFGVREVAIVHRLGRLLVGETSVLIAVASAHRGAAFDACRWVIDTLKKTVPIWKREQFVDGAVWADGEPFPEGIAEAKR